MSPEYELMAKQAQFEQACIAQAKSELSRDSHGNPYAARPHSGIEFLRMVMKRAQEIKDEKLGRNRQ